jgi:hypothetical protein
LKLSDEKALTNVMKCLSRKIQLPEEGFVQYIYQLPGSTILPYGLHVTRDTKWERTAQTPEPTGHHTINSVAGDENGRVYLERLRSLNELMVAWKVELTYQVGSVLDEWLAVKRVAYKIKKDVKKEI